MNKKERFKNIYRLISSLVKYNLKIIFANTFRYFLLAGVIFYFVVVLIFFSSSESELSTGLVYYWLLFPGLLLIFYPTTFGIQNDVDTRMIEILFGIPNYRYKVWLVRMILIYVVVAAILFVLTAISSILLIPLPIFRMVYQLMFPIFFIGCLGFMVSTIVRSGYGTSVVIVIIGLFFWIGTGFLPDKFNLFLNPFFVPSNMNEAIWAETTLNNRIYIFIGIIISVLTGLIQLQKREKFI